MGEAKKKTLRIREQLCPWCGYHISGASPVVDESQRAGPGDASMCIDCGQWGVLDAEMQLHKPTLADSIQIAHNPEAQRLHTAWQMMKRQFGTPTRPIGSAAIAEHRH